MQIFVANKSHSIYAEIICDTIAESANVRGTGIAKRSPEYIISKMKDGDAVIALDGDTFAGFCYIETWEGKAFVANSGLIVHPDFRGQGLAKQIKKQIFDLSRSKYPESKIFSITTGLAVLKMNTDLGYKPVTFSELTTDQTFWNGCQTCKNYDVLQRTEQTMCLCTGLLYDPSKQTVARKPAKAKAFKRLKSIKETLFLKKKKQ